jgi:SagB-type dehydrogenase family enzyme
LSAALAYHRATIEPPGGWERDEPKRYAGPRVPPFHDYGDADRVPLETSVAGPLLQDGAGIVRSRPGRDYGGGTMHWRAYSSAGALYPIEAYVAAPDGLYSFDALARALVPLGGGDARARVADAAAIDGDVAAFVVLTGITARTGWKYLERGYRHVWWDAGTMLANLLALAAADDLSPRLHTAFVDAELNAAVGADGVDEFALAVLALGRAARRSGASRSAPSTSLLQSRKGTRYPLAEAAQRAGELADADAVRAWRVPPEGDEPRLDRGALADAMRRRTSVRSYAQRALPRGVLAELVAWSEASIPADAPRVVRQLVTIAAVDGLDAGVYDARLDLLSRRDEAALRDEMRFVAMEQDHPREAAVNVFQLADLDDVVARLGDRGYRWAQLEAGIRAGRLQIGAFMRGWGAAASTFYDEEVSRALGTSDAPMLMVAIGPRA